MNRHLRIGSLVVLVLAVPLGTVHGQASKGAKYVYGHVLQSRKADEIEFTKDTRKYGVEVFRDENNNNLIFITETGAIAVVPAPATLPPQSKPAKFAYGLSVQVRKADEPDFSNNTKKYGIEAFKDENLNATVYISEIGSIFIGPAAPATISTPPKGAKFSHGLSVQSRKAGEVDFTKDTKKYGIEAYRDENTGNLLYITETGSLVVLAVPAQPTSPVKGAKFTYGLVLPSRKADEADFGMKKFGIELYRDDNNNQLLAISEVGALALPPAAVQPTPMPKGATFSHGLVLPARKPDELDFTKDTKRYGIEVFRDENTNNLFYISETGSIAMVPGK